MEKASFILNDADFNFNGESSSSIKFVGPQANLKHTHITIIAGANGTSKSRIISSIVEKLYNLHLKTRQDGDARKITIHGTHGVTCTNINTLGEKNNSIENVILPSKVLAISNLVMDKFHFSKSDHSEDGFYQYLGVRQATNLTTTGSLERAVTEAVLRMSTTDDKLESFKAWQNLVFGGDRELALQFTRLKIKEIESFLNDPDKMLLVEKRMVRRSPRETITQGQIGAITRDITELFTFLQRKLTNYPVKSSSQRSKEEPFLRLSTLTSEEKFKLGSLALTFNAATKAGYSAWPSLCFEANPWFQFSQLSSGEQNLISVGAKLIAYAEPGSLIVIDEPEVSLNVAWQQHYTDLIMKSLTHAPGTHVLIATHSPHLIASLPLGSASIVTIEKTKENYAFKTSDALFEGWGSEAVLYQVLGITSASSFLFNRKLARVLKHIQDGGKEHELIQGFLDSAYKLDYRGIEPLEEIINEIEFYLESIA
ncbi:ATP-binding protein [Pseudomonas koreensis]|uniref:ATP-binding protein n=1 Tax=Pseudomonas koreensis TaxID=198620 RepID=UPI0021C6FEFA|nr:ATP-binding protein [Pseudomonas koreensis]MCU0091323.1 ATP-binding protein [Pseudomonas koreensis]